MNRPIENVEYKMACAVIIVKHGPLNRVLLFLMITAVSILTKIPQKEVVIIIRLMALSSLEKVTTVELEGEMLVLPAMVYNKSNLLPVDPIQVIRLKAHNSHRNFNTIFVA